MQQYQLSPGARPSWLPDGCLHLAAARVDSRNWAALLAVTQAGRHGGVWDHELVARLMGNETYRQQQWATRRAAHIAPINAFVDGLMASPGQTGVPYVAPVYGGVNARALFIARDPGPKTQSELDGSGFLSLENDDATAERFATLLEGAGIPVAETLPWNAYPWYINHKPSAAGIRSPARSARSPPAPATTYHQPLPKPAT